MDSISLLTSHLAGRYNIEREIGAGGMATVYLARDVKHNRRVALKVLRPDLGAVLGLDRFLSEIQVTANLQHPNLLPLFDSGEAGGQLFYVMPFVEGETLRTRLDREKQLPVEEAVRISTAIANALEHAHGQGVIHRDLKPENILMQSGEPVIADFGIALAVSNAGAGRVTQTGISLGTPQYMSPEQATGDRAIDARTDIYSLGAMLYEMLTGDPPYLAGTSQAIIAKMLTEKPSSVRVARPNVPPHVEAAVARALEKLPADRFASAREFADALSGRISATSYQSSLTPAAKQSLAARIVSPLPLATGIIVGAAAAIAVWSALNRPAPQPQFRAAIELGDSANYVPGTGVLFAISPDGRVIAYRGGTSTNSGIFLRRLDAPSHSCCPTRH